MRTQALASTSATPGHTRCFHFFPINQPATVDPVRAGSSSGPSVARTAKNSTVGSSNSEPIAPSKAPFKAYFVDVPGLGFAGEYARLALCMCGRIITNFLVLFLSLKATDRTA